jgi:hypothetical protein
MSLERRLFRCEEPECDAAFLSELALRGHQNAHAEEAPL